MQGKKEKEGGRGSGPCYLAKKTDLGVWDCVFSEKKKQAGRGLLMCPRKEKRKVVEGVFFPDAYGEEAGRGGAGISLLRGRGRGPGRTLPSTAAADQKKGAVGGGAKNMEGSARKNGNSQGGKRGTPFLS